METLTGIPTAVTFLLSLSVSSSFWSSSPRFWIYSFITLKNTLLKKKLMRHIFSVLTPSLRFSSMSATILKSGDILNQARIYSNSDILEYEKLTHDSNPLHFDLESAQNAGFQDRLVPGMLVASLFPRIIASHFPGAVYVSQSLQFKLPVYVGEEIMGEVQATNIREFRNKHLAMFKTKCFKDGNQLVIDGEATALLPTRFVKKSC